MIPLSTDASISKLKAHLSRTVSSLLSSSLRSRTLIFARPFLNWLDERVSPMGKLRRASRLRMEMLKADLDYRMTSMRELLEACRIPPELLEKPPKGQTYANLDLQRKHLYGDGEDDRH